MNLIGINGFKKSGKDTSFGFLHEGLDAKVERRAFADKLKLMAALALGFERPDDELIALMDECKDYWLLNVVKNATPLEQDYLSQRIYATPFHTLSGREYLQWFGGHARRVFGDTFWIDQVLPVPHDPLLSVDVDALRERFDGADWGVVTDCRYPNEAERVLALGGEVWEIVRPGLTSDGHSSEQPLPRELVTRTIQNDRDITQLRDRVLYAAQRYGAMAPGGQAVAR